MKTLRIGKSSVDSNCFYAAVTGGGKYGPGQVLRFNGADYRPVNIVSDDRSGSKRSGQLVFDVSSPGVYKYVRVADSNSSEVNGYFERDDAGNLTVLDRAADRNPRLIALYPGYAQILADRKATAVLQAQNEAAQQLRDAEAAAERSAQYARDLTARKAAAEIARENLRQSGVKLPTLTGTTKQKAWANDIRAAFALKHPSSNALTLQTAAKWWIDNR